MRVLFSAIGSVGHLFPLVPLARGLADAGHDVAIATAETMRPSVVAAGFEHIPCGLSLEARMARVRELVPDYAAIPPARRRIVMYGTNFAAVAAPVHLPDLIAAADAWRPDAIVHDASELAAPIVARLRGIPAIHHSFGRMIPLDALEEAGRLVEPLWRDAGLEPPPYAGMFLDLYVDISPPSFSVESVPTGTRVTLLRPGGFDRETVEEAPHWLASLPDRPTVYVTLGTVHSDPRVFRVLLDGIASEDINVVVTTGRGVDPLDLAPQPPNVRIESYIPQSAVLAVADAVVSHGGSGSMLATIAHGLPAVMVPQGADQFDNAEACVRAGAAIALPPPAQTPDAVGAALRSVLADGSYRAAAGRLCDEIAAMPSVDEVVPIVESVVGARVTKPS